MFSVQLSIIPSSVHKTHTRIWDLLVTTNLDVLMSDYNISPHKSVKKNWIYVSPRTHPHNNLR